MGTDIHFYVEKINNKNKWEYIYIKDKEDKIISNYMRDYNLFNLLANVRGEGHEDLTKLRGLPYNLSSEINAEYEKDKSCYHSKTWYMLSELYSMKKFLELEKENKLLSPEYLPEDKIALKEDYEDLIDSLNNFCALMQFIGFEHSMFSLDKLRVVVWFDS